MGYHKYGIIDSASYNQFVGLINSVYGDANAGSTGATANLGYGQGNIPTASGIVTANQWTALFSRINNIWTHQGASMSTVGATCPIPSSVSQGNLQIAYNDYLTSQSLVNVIGYLTSNRLVTPPLGQFSQINLYNTSGGPSSPSWGSTNSTKLLRLSFQVDFGNWDNARYFFNSGGAITIAGTGTGATPEDIFWATMLSNMGVVKLMWHNTATTPNQGSSIGFYDLTNTVFTKIFEKGAYGGSYASYSANRIAIYAQLNSAPGTDGKVNIRVELISNEVSTTSSTTAGALTFQIGSFQSAGIVPYPGPAVTVTTPVYAVLSNVPNPSPPVPLIVNMNSLSAYANIVGTGTATSSTITATVTGGTAPYTYAWTNSSNTVTFSSPTGSSTTFSKSLAAGELQSGLALLTVTDNVGTTTNVAIPWVFNSNLVNSPTGT